jgi:acyl-CoA thioesterase
MGRMTDASTDPADDVYGTDLASTPRGDGVRDLVMTDRWNTPLGRPNGGYILAAMLRGLGEEMGVETPLVAAITYHAAPSNGVGTITTRPVRAGRRVQTGDATLHQGDRLIAQLTASFGQRFGPTLELGSPPDLPDPTTMPDPRENGMPDGGIFDRVDYRLTQVPGYLAGRPSGDPTTELWQRRSDGRPADWPALAFLCDSFAPPVLELGPDTLQNSMTIQLTVHFHRLPATEWIATRLTTRHLIEGFHDEDCELWDADGNLLAQSRQLALGV